jgi:hypothetical protein
MARFGKLAASALLILPIALGGCRPTKGTANPEEYFPLIQVAFAGGGTASMIGYNEAIKAKNFEGCVAATFLITAFDSAAEVLAGRLQDKIVIPAVDIDVSGCLALRADADVTESVSLHGPIVVVTQIAGYVAPAKEEAPSEEAPPAEPEPAAEEVSPAEEALPEEPEPPVEPDVAATMGHPEAAALVEAIAGITIAAVLHYATKLQSANCKKGTAAIGAVNYVGGMIKPVADEIAEPDGKMPVPSVVIDLSGCKEG